jgi:beta-glucosidase
VLPLHAKRLETVALIGAGADAFTTGGGSANVSPFPYVSPRAAIEERAGKGVKVAYDDGSDRERAARLAAASDVAIVFAADYQTEFVDRRCISLQCPNWNGDQDALIDAVATANRRTVVVLETGGPVLTPWRDKAAAIVEAWYAGNAGGHAIARVLFGRVDPGGRLPATFPRSEDQYPYAGDPEAYPGVNQEVFYKEGVAVGYRWFDQKRLKPAFPFGFGLSYTTWKLYRPTLSGRTVTARVRNTGRRKGTTVLQLYVGLASSAAVPQPPRALRRFRKIALRPGRTATIRFKLTDRDLSYWDTGAHGWRVARGEHRVHVGFSSRRIRTAGTITP